jgi:acetylornithine deacetylase/succinyl-diaminopimelate desuccinylase-like protein
MDRFRPELDDEAILAFARELVAIPTRTRRAPRTTNASRASPPSSTLWRSLTTSWRPATTSRAAQEIVAIAGEPGPLLYLHGHYDVVPAFGPEQFEPQLVAGRLVGRGASDMKGGLAAIVYAARSSIASGLRRSDGQPTSRAGAGPSTSGLRGAVGTVPRADLASVRPVRS